MMPCLGTGKDLFDSDWGVMVTSLSSVVRDQAGGLPLTGGNPARAAATGELAVLGGFRLVLRGELTDVSLTGQRLIAALVCHSGPVHRRVVAQQLWPDVTNSRAFANLRTSVYRIERMCPGLVEVSSTYLGLAAGFHTDLERTTRLANEILASAGPMPSALLADALRANLYEDLLPDLDEEWLREYQDRYRQLRLGALETLSRRLTMMGNHSAAVYTALAAVQADSLRDSAHQTLVRACLTQGNRQEALSHFRNYQRIFSHELGVAPSVTISQLA
jgi:DNA-binding SARP family transcriptional activator